jgi:phosphoesterase RecJ-like protein
MIDPNLSHISANIKLLLHQAEHILLISHIRPDGDAIGSLIGMGLALKAHGKQVEMILTDNFPNRYRFLKGIEDIQRAPKQVADLTITLDCSDLQRIGDFFQGHQPDVNIDHHITNERFAKNNLVITSAVASACILVDYLPEWGFPLNPDAASALTMAILTDTNGFKTPNVTPGTFRMIADLMEQGVDLPEIYYQALVRQSLQTSKLWGLVLSKLQKQNGLVWTSITLQDRSIAKYHGTDDAEITNFLISIENSKVALLFNEQSNQKTKVSWRSRNMVDVAQLAQIYGGGGHSNAAGAEVNAPLDQVIQKIIKSTREFMVGRS